LSAVRETIERFREAVAVPFGVNPDDAVSHLAFIQAFDFPFDLLVDEDRKIAAAYDALKPDGTGINRTVVGIGKDGRILFYERGAPPPGNILQALRSAES
jgi:peroxiredoxin Q/BCP